PRLTDHAEALLEIGNQLGQQRVAVGSVVDRIHRIGVVEIWRGVLEGHRDQPREVRRTPCLIKLKPRLAHRSGQPRGPLYRRLDEGVGRKTERRSEIEVALLVYRRITSRGV